MSNGGASNSHGPVGMNVSENIVQRKRAAYNSWVTSTRSSWGGSWTESGWQGRDWHSQEYRDWNRQGPREWQSQEEQEERSQERRESRCQEHRGWQTPQRRTEDDQTWLVRIPALEPNGGLSLQPVVYIGRRDREGKWVDLYDQEKYMHMCLAESRPWTKNLS